MKMKINLSMLIVLMLLGVTEYGYAQENEFAAVARTVNYYLEGGTNNDFSTLKLAFSEDAMMMYMKDNQYTSVNALEFFGAGMKPGPKQDRETRIISINVTGNAANARLEIEYPTFTFIDYMNLLKIDGHWKIVNKIFYKKG